MVRKKEAIVLFVGDICVLFVSLYLTITLRNGSLPTQNILLDHLAPFSILFILSILINFISGLYEKHTLVLKSKLPKILAQVQIANTVVSLAFFYFIPYFTITPKITLFMYLVISLIIMVAWRMAIAQTFGTRRRSRALLLAYGKEAKDLYEEINHNPRYGMSIVKWVDTSLPLLNTEEIIGIIKKEKISFVIADFNHQRVNEIMPILYGLIFSGVQFSDVQKVYEEIFDRVPLSIVNDIWFLENVSSSVKTSFDIFKRLIDIVASTIFGITSLIFYPFIYLAIKIDDRGVIFSYQDRVGQNNKIVKIVKFRTMTVANDMGKWDKQINTITRIGKILRKSRLDELPQFWNILRGDISLVGPRPEFEEAVNSYSKVIPYYNIRHIVKPGLFGWAQIYHERHPHHGLDIEETRNKLSYDLYYIKNRSFILDFKITLKTLKILISFAGR